MKTTANLRDSILALNRNGLITTCYLPYIIRKIPIFFISRHKVPIVWPWVKTLFSLVAVMALFVVSPPTPFNLLPHYLEHIIWAWMYPKAWLLATWCHILQESDILTPQPLPMTNKISKSLWFTMIIGKLMTSLNLLLGIRFWFWYVSLF